MVIRNFSFDHKGGYYHYRVHKLKLNNLCSGPLKPLKDYLEAMFESCPDKYFFQGPRSSSLKFKLSNLDVKNIPKHELCLLTHHGLEKNNERYSTAHSKVQVFMLEHDSSSIACEVPLWLKHNELKTYQKLFNSTEPLTGHIDILRVQDNKIWILDYKPNAQKEQYAATQIYFYALMLSVRTKIPLEHFRCGYFDHLNCYLFDPNSCSLPISKSIEDF
ncbi:MAG: PD-(D/E)XK nuclease family protein [Nanoarchaeota archaeon]|nr:PD-(D/E)XK nuclease family protein [Nanoarchaeota archaeon]